MRTKLFLIAISIIATLLFFNCSQNENNGLTEPNKSSNFTNPYAYIGEGHNKICKEYLETNKELDLPIISKMSKNFLIKKGHFSDNKENSSYFINNFSKIFNLKNTETLNKITETSWLDSLFSTLVNQGKISKERKQITLSFLNTVLNAEGDTNLVNDYCDNLPETIDSITKANILVTAAVYNASCRLWIDRKSNKLSKIQLTILGVDAVGAAVGGILYAARYQGDWSWSDFGWQTLEWGIGASLGEALGVWKIFGKKK